MNKYFKNDKAVTIESILKTYTDYRWGMHPEFTSNTNKFYRLEKECQETDEYTNYLKELKVAEAKYRELKADVEEIEANREQIIIKNSEEEYSQTLKHVKD